MKIDPNLLKFYRQDPVDEDLIAEIAESFNLHGQRHPVTVHKLNSSARTVKDVDGTYFTEYDYKVIAGRKRVLAAIKAGIMLECEVIEGDLHATRIEEISLHENLKRTNLPWYERATLVGRLHNLQQELHGVPAQPKGGAVLASPTSRKTGWGIRDTQKLVDSSLGTVSQDLNLAKALMLNPSLSKVKDRKTAIKLVRRETQRINNEQQGTIVAKGLEEDQAFNDDSSNILMQLPEKTFHVCITDPPWINFFDAKYTIDQRTAPVFKELFRVMRWDSYLYMFCGLDDYNYYAGTQKWNEETKGFSHEPGLLEKIGWKVSKTPLIWIKGKALSRRGVSAWEYGRNFEFILLAVKGSPVLTSQTQMDATLNFDAVHPTKLIHPNEKPINLIKRLLNDSCYEGNYVIDPFAGSFVVGEACKKSERRYVMIERDRNHYERGCKRIGLEP